MFDAFSPDPGNCLNPNTTTAQQCQRMRGGFYERNPDDGWVEDERPDFSTGGGPINQGSDSIYLGDTEVPSTPLFIEDNFLMNGLGMGPDSLLLNKLKDDGYIASKSWSMWRGQYANKDKEEVDGHIIFGGVDEAKLTGESETFPTQPIDREDCDSGFVIEATGLSITTGARGTVELQNAPFQRYCLVPAVPLLSLTEDAYDTILDSFGNAEVIEPTRMDDILGLVGNGYRDEEA